MNSKHYDLFKFTQEEYGPAYHDYLLSQYELYVKSAESISDRRQNANSHFITINVAIISLLGILFQVKWLEVVLWIACVGIATCAIFYVLLGSYRQLNKTKFDVIWEIEEKLPAQVYGYEWHLLSGHQQKRYLSLSCIEKAIPVVFGLAYLGFVGFWFYQ